MLQHRNLRDWPTTEDWLLDTYFEGWAEADADLILSATAPNYCFHDPLVGRFARAGATKRRDVAFILCGPMIGTHGQQFWREAPALGLTGTSEIILGPHGIVSERVAYDLNLACGQLRRQQ